MSCAFQQQGNIVKCFDRNFLFSVPMLILVIYVVYGLVWYYWWLLARLVIFFSWSINAKDFHAWWFNFVIKVRLIGLYWVDMTNLVVGITKFVIDIANLAYFRRSYLRFSLAYSLRFNSRRSNFQYLADSRRSNVASFKCFNSDGFSHARVDDTMLVNVRSCELFHVLYSLFWIHRMWIFKILRVVLIFDLPL